MTIQDAIKRVMKRKHLTQNAAYKLTLQIMEGEATDAQIGALLIGLAMKGETISEIVGFVRAMRQKVTPVVVEDNDLVDTCGTGGDHRLSGDGGHTIPLPVSTRSQLTAIKARRHVPQKILCRRRWSAPRHLHPMVW